MLPDQVLTIFADKQDLKKGAYRLCCFACSKQGPLVLATLLQIVVYSYENTRTNSPEPPGLLTTTLAYEGRGR